MTERRRLLFPFSSCSRGRWSRASRRWKEADVYTFSDSPSQKFRETTPWITTRKIRMGCVWMSFVEKQTPGRESSRQPCHKTHTGSNLWGLHLSLQFLPFDRVSIILASTLTLYSKKVCLSCLVGCHAMNVGVPIRWEEERGQDSNHTHMARLEVIRPRHWLVGLY